MRCYVDSSVILRRVLLQTNVLKEWSQIRFVVSSRLVRLECLRTIDRVRLHQVLTDDTVVQRREEILALLETIHLLPMTRHIYRRAEQPFITPVGSLDALHLTTALLWRETRGDDLVFATHDGELGRAAKAHGFQVIGV